MFRLTIEDKHGGVADQYSFEDGEFYIGRSQASDIELPSDNVSRRHARLYTVDGRCYIEDLDSANGVYVNGRRITEVYAIQRAAKIKVGDYYLHVEALAEEEEPNVHFRLVGLTAPLEGQTITVEKRTSLVGRGKDCAIVVIDKSVSRVHGRISVERSGAIMVEDLKSSNGTFVNDARVESATVRDGDHIRFGNVEFQVEIPGAEGEHRAAPADPEAGGRRLHGLEQQLVRPGRAEAIDDDIVVPGRKNPWMVVSISLGVLLLAAVVVVVLFRDKLFGSPEAPPPPVAEPVATEPAGPTPEELAAERQKELDGILEVGRERLRQRQWDLALESFETALAKHPTNDEAREAVNRIRLWKKDLERLDNARKLARDLKRGEAATMLREIDAKSEYYVDAQEELKKLVSGIPVMMLTADNALTQKDCATALRTLRDALTVDPSNEQVSTRITEVESFLSNRRKCKPAP